MRIKFFLAFLLLAGTACAEDLSLFGPRPPKPKIPWVRSVSAAVSLARQYNRPILVYVTANNCGHCKRMERDAWNNPQIIAMVQSGYIPLEVNADTDEETVAALKLRGFPATLLFSADARFIDGAIGYLPPGGLATLLRGDTRTQPVPQQVTQRP